MDLLVELFSEEIPARMQAKAAEDFLAATTAKFKDVGISISASEIFFTPRRIGFIMGGIPESLQDTTEERKGPRTNAPKEAIDGFLKSTGLEISQLHKETKGKDEYYMARITRKALPVADSIKTAVEDVLSKMVWPKSMRWGSYETRWVRPLHSIICLLDASVIPVKFGHITAGNKTRGHRFMAGDEITVQNPQQYFKQLEAAFVMAKPDVRKAAILKQVESLASMRGVTLTHDNKLLDEVTGLVEWPTALMGDIEPQYMHLPAEVLITVMKNHQRYFSFRKTDGAMAPYFATVSNIVPKDGGAHILAGNARVIRARLEDARFYWEGDLKTPLQQRIDGLKDVVFHAKIGTLLQRVERIKEISAYLASKLNINPEKAIKAATLAKADLASGVVGEMPELQGLIGSYIAIAQGEDAEVAAAIEDHYKPVGADDDVPTKPVSICVALAEKIDTIVSLFAIGEKPTGSRDPFALRRACLGIIRTLLENKISINLKEVFEFTAAISSTPKGNPKLLAEIDEFVLDRLRYLLKDKGLRFDYINAAFAVDVDRNLHNITMRAQALASLLATQDGENLLSAYRRASNILKIELEKDKAVKPDALDESLLKEIEEKALITSIKTVGKGVENSLITNDYEAAMKLFAELRAPVDSFFDKVLVNVEDKSIRANRLALLSEIRNFMNMVADFGVIEVA